MATNADLYKKHRAALAEAVRWSHPDYTNNGITRERAKRVAQARNALRAAVPKKSERPGGDGRARVLDGLAPKTADQVAVTAHAWSKIEKRLDAGQSLHTLVTTADRDTLAAILDGISTRSEVLAAGDDGAAIVQEVRATAFNRLLELGDKAAVSADASASILDRADAWVDFLAESADGEPTVATRSALAVADPDGYAAIASADPVGDVETNERIRGLDRLVSTGAIQVEGV